MNSRLILFNKQLERCACDAHVGTVKCPILIKDIDNRGLTETKYMYIPLDVVVAIGDTITCNNKKYMVLNINGTDCYNEVVVQEIYHFIKVKYSWLSVMIFNCIVDVATQTMIDTTYLVQEKTTINIQLQRNTTSRQIRKGTRFFMFDVPYTVDSITYENGNILKLRCNVDGIKPTDDTVNQIADNSQFNPPAIKYTITSSAGAGGTISPLGSVEVEKGKLQAFTITPNEGYEIDTVLVDSVSTVISNNQYTFSNVSADHVISVTFKEKPVASNLVIKEINETNELYKGYENQYALYDGVNQLNSVTWSMDVTWATIRQDGKYCWLKFDSLKDVGKIIVLSALYNGTTYTKSVETTTF